MLTSDELQTRLDNLRKARASGMHSVQHGTERVEYKSDAEMASAIADLERQLAGAQNTSIVRQYRIGSEKGL